MGKFYDSVPVSAIVRIRDMMYTVKDPFRLDQGDVSFDAPETFKQAVAKAMTDNRTHYLPTSGIPPLRKAFAEKMRKKNGIPIGSDDEILVTNGGTHGLFAVFQALLEPGDEVIIPDPEWPPTMAMIQAAGGKAVQVPLREECGWRWNIDDVEKAITPKTRVLYINSPNNPTGGVIPRAGHRAARRRSPGNATCWVVSDEAYEDVVYQGRTRQHRVAAGDVRPHHSRLHDEQVLRDTGVRVGYFAIKDKALRDRARRWCSTARATCRRSRSTAPSAPWKARSSASRTSGRSCCSAATCSTRACRRPRPAMFSGTPPDGAFYAFVKINPEAAKAAGITGDSLSWAMAEYLIKHARIGCVPGVDFGAEQRRLHPLLHLPIARRAHRRAGVDERSALARRGP